MGGGGGKGGGGEEPDRRHLRALDEFLRPLEVGEEAVLFSLAEEMLERGPAPPALAVDLVALTAVLAVDRRAADADRLGQLGEPDAVLRDGFDVREEGRQVLVGVFAVLLGGCRLRALLVRV